LRTSYNRTLRPVIEKINLKGNIIIAGSSWSMNAARIVKDYLKDQIRLTFIEHYDETIKLTQDDILIAISYSGNSEEATSWIKYARRTNTKTIIITSGGRLAEDSFNSPVIELVKGIPSRCSTFTIIGTLLRLFEDANLIETQRDEVQNAVNYIREQDITKISEELSQKIQGIIPVIYSTNSIKNAANKFKRLINANAKTTAFYNEIPGAEYYEAEGYNTKNAQFHALILTTTEDLSRVKKKTNIFKDAIQNQGINVTELNIKGKGLVKQASTLIIGDLTSYYLALRYKKDPLNEEITKKIKSDLGIYI
jgi:bifunctional phosphoglucose/phosphomannose isomerase